MPQQSFSKTTSSSTTVSSLMCCTSDRSSKTLAYKESQSRFLWLDPTRWVEKRSKKEVGLHFFISLICSKWLWANFVITYNSGAPLAREHRVHVHPSILRCTRPENNPQYMVHPSWKQFPVYGGMVHPSCRLPKGAPEFRKQLLYLEFNI